MNQPSIRIEKATRNFGTKGAISNISFAINAGSIFGLLGPNGAGKTTTLRICSTLLRPTSGKIYYNGEEFNESKAFIRQKIAVMPQGNALDPFLNVRDNLKFYCKLRNIPSGEINKQMDQVIYSFGIKDILDRSVFALSGGQFRRVQLARTFLGKPEYVLLDEPTLGIDIQGKMEIWKTIPMFVSENKCAVLLASNDLMEVENICQEVGFINSGKLLYQGKTNGLAKQNIVRLQIKLGQPFVPIENDPDYGITIQKQSDYELILTGREYDSAFFDILSKLSMQNHLLGIEEEKASLTDLFEKYGGKQE
jgi:ABC-2 type transport system ATP-binding protein